MLNKFEQSLSSAETAVVSLWLYHASFGKLIRSWLGARRRVVRAKLERADYVRNATSMHRRAKSVGGDPPVRPAGVGCPEQENAK